MSKVLKSVLTLALVFGFTLTSALAGTQDRNRAGDRQQKKDRSCQQDLIKSVPTMDLAAKQNRHQHRNADQDRKGDQDRKRDQDRLKDGSCNSAGLDQLTGIYLAADQTRTRDRDQDGDQTKTTSKTRDQLKDGSCKD